MIDEGDSSHGKRKTAGSQVTISLIRWEEEGE
jgi:hypothetical protein